MTAAVQGDIDVAGYNGLRRCEAMRCYIEMQCDLGILLLTCAVVRRPRDDGWSGREKETAGPARERLREGKKEAVCLTCLPVGPKQDLARTESGRGGRSLGTISLGYSNYGSGYWSSNFAGQYLLGWLREWARCRDGKGWMAASAEGGVGCKCVYVSFSSCVCGRRG